MSKSKIFDEILRHAYQNGLSHSLDKYIPDFSAHNTAKGAVYKKCLGPMPIPKPDKWNFDHSYFLGHEGKLAPDFCHFLDTYFRTKKLLIRKENDLPDLQPIIKTAKDRWVSKGIFPIFILYYKYNYFSPEDTRAFIRNAGKSQVDKVYELSEASVFDICILSDNLQPIKETVFLLSPEFIFSNCLDELTDFQIDINDGGGLQEVDLSSPKMIKVNYTSLGKKGLTALLFDQENLQTKVFFYERFKLSLGTTLELPKDTEKSNVVFMITPGQGGGSVSYDPMVSLAKEFGFDVEFTAEETYKGSDHSIGEVAEDIIRVIKKINSEKPDHSLVILGYSMGGLTTQYAIGKLLAEGYDPKIKAYISLDGPIRGVNVPLAYQFFLLKVPDSLLDKEAKEDKKNLLKKGALEMMRYCHYGTGQVLQGPAQYCIDAKPHASHIALMNKLSDLKIHPEWRAIKKIGFASGSKDKLFSANDLFFKFGKKCLNHFGKLQFYRVGNQLKYLLYSENSEGYPEGDLRLNSVPVDLDRAPGCLSDVPAKVNRGIIQGLKDNLEKKFDEKKDVAVNIQHCCYIPTISALDIDTDDPFFTANKSIEEIRKASWFDEITISETNGSHIPKNLSEEQKTILRNTFASIQEMANGNGS